MRLSFPYSCGYEIEIDITGNYISKQMASYYFMNILDGNEQENEIDDKPQKKLMFIVEIVKKTDCD